MKKENERIILLLAVVICFTACTGRSSQTDSKSATAIDSSWIHVTQAQFEAMGMKLDTLSKISFSEKLRVNGHIISPVNGQAQITGRLPGTIRHIFHEQGDLVSAGSLLCTIESNEFLDLQQSFINIDARYREAKAAYERQRILYEDTITSKREFMTAESTYLGIKAQFEGMKQRLSLLKVNLEDLEKGNLQPLLHVTAPIEGHITQIDCMPGEYVTPDKNLMTMVNVSQLHLQLDLYEKDIQKLTPGQLVEYYHPDNPTEVQKAHLTRIGKTTETQKKTVTCIASLTRNNAKLIHNMYVVADIILSERDAAGVPKHALDSKGETDRIYLLAKKVGIHYYLEPFDVIVGIRSENFAEIINDVPPREILVEGVYNLPAVE